MSPLFPGFLTRPSPINLLNLKERHHFPNFTCPRPHFEHHHHHSMSFINIMLYYLYGHGMDSFPVPVRLNNRKQISEWCYHIFYIICSLNFFATFQQNFCCYNDHHKHWYNNSKNVHYQPVWVHCYMIWWHPEMKIKYKN